MDRIRADMDAREQAIFVGSGAGGSKGALPAEVEAKIPCAAHCVQALCPPLSNRNFVRVQEWRKKRAVIGRRIVHFVIKIGNL